MHIFKKKKIHLCSPGIQNGRKIQDHGHQYNDHKSIFIGTQIIITNAWVC